MGGTEKAEIVYEVRDETKDIAVEKGLQKAYSINCIPAKTVCFLSTGEIELSRLAVHALSSGLSLLSSLTYILISL